MQVKKKLTEQQLWDKVRVMFVTVDPARDTAEKLAQYVPYFDPEFIGLTGSLENITQFTRSLAIPFRIGEKDENGFYEVDHSASVLLIDDQGNLAALISPPFTVTAFADDLVKILQE